jgi:hypothetical protein
MLWHSGEGLKPGKKPDIRCKIETDLKKIQLQAHPPQADSN